METAHVVRVDISAEEPKRAAAFYSEVFGWTIEKKGETFRIKDVDATISQRQQASDRVVEYIEVKSLDEVLPRIAELGGEIVKERTTVPGVGYTALCLDPEDNPFGLFEADPSA